MLNELSGMVKAYLESKNHMSVAHLARLCAISPSTLNRVISKEQEPRLETVRSILSVITDYKEGVAFLIKHFSENAAWLQQEGDQIHLSGELNRDATTFFYKNVATFELLQLAKSGVSVKKAEKSLGSQASYVAQALNEGYLKEANGRLKVADYEIATTPELINALETSCKFHSSHEDNLPDLITFSELTGNDEATKLLKDKARELYRLTLKVKTDPKYKGSKSISIGFILGSLDSKKDI